jgi:RimJ/RimL family protein N-acetyltransferase
MKILIREWQISDIKPLAENANNINVWNNLRDYFPYPYTEKDAEEFIAKSLAGEFGIQRAIEVDGKAVGGIGCFPKADVERITTELGYWLGENHWNKGIATQAIKDFVKLVFAYYPEIQKIYAMPFGFNIASQRALEKAGFEREAILKRAAIKNGKVIDLHYFSIWK